MSTAGRSDKAAALIAEARREAQAARGGSTEHGSPCASSLAAASPSPSPNPTAEQRVALLLEAERAQSETRKRRRRRYATMIPAVIVTLSVMAVLLALLR
jgi:hypothetical protein